MNSRLFNIFFILTTQHLFDLSPNLRACIDFIFIFKNDNEQQRKRIYKNHACMIPSFKLFCKLLDTLTDDNNCLVIHNCSPSPLLEDQLFLYKAESHDDLQLCISEAWEFSDELNKNIE